MAALETITVSWNPNTEPDLAGYIIYFTLYPGIYFQTVNIQNSGITSLLFDRTNMSSDGTYYFAVSAYDTSGNQSALSAPVSKRLVRTSSYLIRRR